MRLVRSQAAILLPPPVAGVVANPQAPANLAHPLPLANEHFSLSEFAYDLFRGVAPSRHVVLSPDVHGNLLSPAMTSALDQLSGGRPPKGGKRGQCRRGHALEGWVVNFQHARNGRLPGRQRHAPPDHGRCGAPSRSRLRIHFTRGEGQVRLILCPGGEGALDPPTCASRKPARGCEGTPGAHLPPVVVVQFRGDGNRDEISSPRPGWRGHDSLQNPLFWMGSSRPTVRLQAFDAATPPPNPILSSECLACFRPVFTPDIVRPILISEAMVATASGESRSPSTSDQEHPTNRQALQ